MSGHDDRHLHTLIHTWTASLYKVYVVYRHFWPETVRTRDTSAPVPNCL